MTNIEIFGIYDIPASQPCHLVEMTIQSDEGRVPLSSITYPTRVDLVKSAQAPYREHYLSSDGLTILGNFLYELKHPEMWNEQVRVAFFMHYLEPDGNLHTPAGLVRIPAASVMPKRLKGIEYQWPP